MESVGTAAAAFGTERRHADRLKGDSAGVLVGVALFPQGFTLFLVTFRDSPLVIHHSCNATRTS